MSNSKLDGNIFKKLNELAEKLDQLEKKIDHLEQKMDTSFDIQSNHIMRVKNGQNLSDDFILNKRGYNDMTPERAYKIYQDKDADFLLLDTSSKDYRPERELPEAIKIPFEELNVRHEELPGKTTSILIISENGTNSIKACELLNSLGYYNVNNVSGGYKFWPGLRLKDSSKKSA